MSKHVFIKTYGCQMNEHDTQRMLSMLEVQGYAPVDAPEQADLILVNTCSVRANPENKVYSFLGTLRPLKKRNPDLIVGVAGCVAQQVGETLLQREPLVDLVFGPDNLFALPEMLDSVRRGERLCRTAWQPWDGPVREFVPEQWIEQDRVDGIKAYIAITKGCNNHCSFCIVPRTRGREVSRSPEGILREARSMVAQGAREIWLLGQNVNSYRAGDDYGFLELLDAVSQVEGLARIRFTSPHPRDWNNALSDLMAARPAICNQLHLPFQAGADSVLQAMRRRHTIAEYLDKIHYLKQVVPAVEISTDLIVGFPGESDVDFEQTIQVLEEVRFSQVFPFKYSPRPGTKAADLPDDVPRTAKDERLARVIALQERINAEQQQALVGTTQNVLIDEAHPRDAGLMNGRTEGYRAITVSGEGVQIGDLVNVQVMGFRGHWLEGASTTVIARHEAIS
jgi:tRNA-2-methylthio-N6-dimethylallyladenosine synthase